MTNRRAILFVLLVLVLATLACANTVDSTVDSAVHDHRSICRKHCYDLGARYYDSAASSCRCKTDDGSVIPQW